MEQLVSVDRMEQAVSLFGRFDENIRLIEQQYHVNVVTRDSELKVSGEPEDVASAVFLLCSGALPYVTGQSLDVDGGFHLRRL